MSANPREKNARAFDGGRFPPGRKRPVRGLDGFIDERRGADGAFGDDVAPITTIVKHLKRVMAGEYSRELSEKLIRAHRQQAALSVAESTWRSDPDQRGRHDR